MTATSILKSWEVLPNPGLKKVLFITPNTADQNDTLEITLSDYGIAATGLLSVKGWKHTTDGSIIINAAVTCSVASGVLTVVLASATDNDMRVIEIVGRADPGAFS